MKTLILLCSFLSLVLIGNAQINKGNWLLGMAGTYSKSLDADKTSALSLAPNVGLFVMDKLAVGSSFSIYLSSSSVHQYNSYGLGPFARYYFLNTDSKINLFVQPTYRFSRGRLQYNDPSIEDNKSSSEYFEISAGPALFLNEYVAMEVTANYSNSKNDSYNSEYFTLRIGLQIHLGGKRD